MLLILDPLEDGLDLRQHFYNNHRWLFTLLKGWIHFLAQGTLYLVTILLLFGFNVIAARVRYENFHVFFAVFSLYTYLFCFH